MVSICQPKAMWHCVSSHNICCNKTFCNMSVTDWFIRTQHAPFMWTMSSVHNDSIYSRWTQFCFTTLYYWRKVPWGLWQAKPERARGSQYTSILGGTWNIRTMFQAGKAATITKKWNTTSLSPELGRNSWTQLGEVEREPYAVEDIRRWPMHPRGTMGFSQVSHACAVISQYITIYLFFCLFMSFLELLDLLIIYAM